MEYQIGPGVDSRTLDGREAAGLAWCRALCWEWDEGFFGPAPAGFEDWPRWPRGMRQTRLYRKGAFRCKMAVLEPKWRYLGMQLAEESKEAYWRKYVLRGKSDEEIAAEMWEDIKTGREAWEARLADMGALQRTWTRLTERGLLLRLRMYAGAFFRAGARHGPGR